MSLTEYQLTDVHVKIDSSTSMSLIATNNINLPDVHIEVQSSPSPNLTVGPMPEVVVIAAGNVGPPGPQGQWVSMTQAEYDALVSPDPDTLYVII